MIEVEIPHSAGAEHTAWQVMLDLAGGDFPRWVLVGGLMVHLHLYEAGVTPHRATTDVDALVDVSVRAARATEEFSRRLRDDLHMRMETPSPDGVGHRFTRADGAVIDVLAADFGARSRPHTTVPPARTLEVPGGRGMLISTYKVCMRYDGRSALVERPTLVAAIIGKWRASVEIADQRGDPDRHLRDAAILLTVVDPDAAQVSNAQRKHLKGLLGAIKARPELAQGDHDLVIDALGLLLDP